MKTEEVAKMIADLLRSEDNDIDVMDSGYVDSRTFGLDEVVIDGHYNLIKLVEKLQELGIVENSDNK